MFSLTKWRKWDMNNIDARKELREGLFNKCIKLIVFSYNEIIKSGVMVGAKPIEDQRRNQIIDIMLKNKKTFKFMHTITSESGTVNQNTFKTKGRIDICICYGGFEQKYISFECKRITKKTMSEIKLEKSHYKEGILRYEEGKYDCDSGYAGMVSFLEEGDANIFNQNLIKVLQNHLIIKIDDESDKYSHNYIYSYPIKVPNDKNVLVKHVVMSFSS